MKKIKQVSICIFTSMAILSNCIVVNAETHETVIDVMHCLKNFILTEPDEHSYNYSNYDINRDNKVNVLDMCRLKNSILNNTESDISIYPETTVTTGVSETTTNNQIKKAGFEISDAEIDSDSSTVTVPIRLKNNTIGISAVQMNISYDKSYFTLQSVYAGDFNGGWSVSRDKKYIQFSEVNAHNIKSDGIIGYVEFSVLPDTPAGNYEFSLSEIQASTLPEGAVQRVLTDEECQRSSDKYILNFKGSGTVTARPSDTVITNPTTDKVTTTTMTKVTTTEKITTTGRITTPEETTTTKPSTAKPVPEIKQVAFKIGNDIEVSSDNRIITVPIELKNNTIGISACQMNLDYSLRYFKLVDVYAGDFNGSWIKSKSGNTVQFSEVSAHNITEDGIIGYLEFEVTPGTPAGIYNFSLSAIQASTLPEGAVQRVLTDDECLRSSDVINLNFSGLNIVTTKPSATTVTTSATTAKTTLPETTTTKITTTKATTTAMTTTTAKITTPTETTTTEVTTTTEPVPEIKQAVFKIGNDIEVSKDNSIIILPIELTNNNIGISACQMDLNYSLRYFELTNVYVGDFSGSWSKSRSGSSIQFSEVNAHNITEDGVIGYIEFEVTPGTPAGIYKFSLSSIQASTLPRGSVQRMLTAEECKAESDEYILNFAGLNIITTTEATTTPKQTTTTVTTTPKQTTTTPKQTTTATVKTTTELPDMPDPSQNEKKKAVAELVNKEREKNGFDPMQLDTKLSYVADIRADELKISYTVGRPDGSNYTTLLNKYHASALATYQYIMRGNNSASEIVSMMLKRGAFLDSTYKKIGVGFASGGGYWVVYLTS